MWGRGGGGGGELVGKVGGPVMTGKQRRWERGRKDNSLNFFGKIKSKGSFGIVNFFFLFYSFLLRKYKTTKNMFGNSL